MLVLLAASFFTAQLAPVDFTSSGGQLFANGAPFQIKGAIWRGAEGPGDLPEGLTGVHAHTISHYMEALAEGTFNAVKITFNHQAVLDAAVVEHFDPQVEQSLIGKRYLQALQTIIQEAAAHGLLVALSAARLAPHDSPGNGLWHSSDVPEAAVLRSWTRITNLLCNQPNLFAVDLFEAPHGAAWGVGGANLDWHAAAQRIGNHVLAGCPRLLVMVEGARHVPWLGQPAPELPPGLNLMGVKQAQLHLSNPAKVVYAPALAPPSEHMLPAYRESGFPANMALVWGRQFGFVRELTGSAILLSRAGGLLDDALDKSWQDSLFDWARTQKVGFFYDCFNPNPTNGGLLHKDWSTLRQMKLLLLNGLTGTKVTSIPQSGSAPQGRFHNLEAAEPPSPPAMSELVCIDHVRATGLRGALDWQAGGSSSGTVLSVFTGPDPGPGWGSRLFEVAASVRDHSVQHTPSGDKLQMQLNSSRCFPTGGGGEDGQILCFQIADLTQFGGHVRYVNRGCGLLQRGEKSHTLALNDGAQLTLGATFKPLGDGEGSAGSAVGPILLGLLTPLLVLGAIFASCVLVRRHGVSLSGVRSQLLLGCSKLLSLAGFKALASELSRSAMHNHARLSRVVDGSGGASRGRRKGRGTRTLDLPVVEMIPSGEMLEDIMPSPVHEITLDDAVGQQEEAIKRAMELMDSIKGAEEPPAAVPTLPPPPAAADAAPAVPSESEDDSKLLADISTLLVQANVLMEKPVSEGEAKAED